MITIKVKGDITKNLRRKLDKGLEAIASDLTSELKKETPVDKGYARSRWKKNGKKITNDADYIEALENGHSKQAPDGMLEPAINTIKKRLKSYFK